MLPVPTVAYLAEFTSRPVDSYGPYAEQALAQATLLFTIVTRLSELPEEPDRAQLAINAILEMADRIYLELPHAAAKASPFVSETIASYSYSKGSAVHMARAGIRTGLLWWDLAVDELSLPGAAVTTSGAMTAFDYDQQIGVDADGRAMILPPLGVDDTDRYGYVNAEMSPRPRLG